MGMYLNNLIEINVKVYESKAEAKVKEDGRISKILGNAIAEIKVNDVVIIQKLAGIIGITFKSNTDKNGNVYVTYNQNIDYNGNTYDKVLVGEKLNNYLFAETITSFNKGPVESERDKAIIEDAGMKADEYKALLDNIVGKASESVKNIKKPSAQKKSKDKVDIKKFEKDLGID